MNAVFLRYFPQPYDTRKARRRGVTPDPEPEPEDVYKPIVDWFAAGGAVEVHDEAASVDGLLEVPTLADLAQRHLAPRPDELPAACELVLEGLHQASLLAKDRSPDGVTYGDMLKRMFAGFED